jgi:ribosomal protein S12 methylthiotransferase accessory factor
MNQYKDILKKLLNLGLDLDIKENPIIADEPKRYGFICTRKGDEIIDKNNSPVGIGYSKSPQLAKIKAIAELIERKAIANPILEEITHLTYKEDSQQISPINFLNYSRKQITDDNIDVRRIVNQKYIWFPVKDLIHNKVLSIPAQLVFVSNKFSSEYPINKESISTGTAFGDKKSKLALTNAILEIVERDSAMGLYFKKIIPKQIISFPTDIQKEIDYLGRYNLDATILDVTSDLGIPSIIVIVIDKTGIGDTINIGMSSELTYSDAILKALNEAIMFRNLNRVTKNRIKKEIDNVHTEEDRYWYWNKIERIRFLDDWINPKKTIDFNKLPKNKLVLDNIIDIFRYKGYSVLKANITPDFLKNTDFEVVKVIIPEMHPLYLNEQAIYLYSKHYGEVMRNSEFPHPFG